MNKLAVSCTVMFHDHEPYIEYVLLDKLDTSDFVENEFLKAYNSGQNWCNIDASNWENELDKFPSNGGIGISVKASRKKLPNDYKLVGSMILRIDFDA